MSLATAQLYEEFFLQHRFQVTDHKNAANHRNKHL